MISTLKGIFMSGKIDLRLEELGIVLPEITKSAANYMPYAISGETVYVAGQLPLDSDGNIVYKGHIGDNTTVEQGQDATRMCGIRILSILKHACNGDFDRVVKILVLNILISSTSNFYEHHLAANGVSNLMIEVFGNKIGSHARIASGSSSLPFNALAEVYGTFVIM